MPEMDVENNKVLKADVIGEDSGRDLIGITKTEYCDMAEIYDSEEVNVSEAMSKIDTHYFFRMNEFQDHVRNMISESMVTHVEEEQQELVFPDGYNGILWSEIVLALREFIGPNYFSLISTEYTWWWGYLDFSCITFYMFPRKHMLISYPGDLDNCLHVAHEISKNCGFWYPRRNVCVCVKKPIVFSHENNRLHNPAGPALAYSDGLKVYAWQGQRVPSEWFTGNLPTPEEAFTIENMELRRCAFEMIGWVKVIEGLNHRVIDEHEDPYVGKLIEVDLPDSPGERFLLVKCGTGRDFALMVDPEAKTALEANLGLWGLPPDRKFVGEIRT